MRVTQIWKFYYAVLPSEPIACHMSKQEAYLLLGNSAPNPGLHSAPMESIYALLGARVI